MPTITTFDPATGRELATYDAHDEAAVAAALAGAHAAYLGWSARPLGERTDLLRAVGKLLTERREEYAALMTAEMGKPLAEALAEVDKCAWNCEVVADSAPEWLADHEVASGAARSWLSYEPLGVVFAVMPWNYPFWQVLRFASAALVAGNAGVLKHSPNVTGCALAIERVFADAGAPAGLFTTLVLADEQLAEMTPRIIGDPAVAAVTLTGSERAGEAVGSAAGRFLKKSVLELGGSDPFVVLDDADLEAAADVAVKSRFGNGGQSCIAAKRFIVAESVADEFVSLLTTRIAALELGPMARGDLRDQLHAQVAGLGLRRGCPRRGWLVAGRPGLVLPADGARPRDPADDGLRRGDLRPGGRGGPGPRRRPRGGARERHGVRARCRRLVALVAWARGGQADPLRRAVRQRDGRLRPAAAVRRHRPVGLRPRAVGRGHARVHQRAHGVRGFVMRFDHVGVNVASLDEMRDWYVGALGLEVEFEFALEAFEFSGAMLRSPEGWRVELLHRVGNVAGIAVERPMDAALTRGFGHLALTVDDLEATYDRLLAAGAASRMPPSQSPEPGVRIAFVADPEGNLIELLDRGRGGTKSRHEPGQ